MFMLWMWWCVRAEQGRLLDYIVSWGSLTEEKVAFYLRDVLEALHYLHSWRIAHLDVKVRRSHTHTHTHTYTHTNTHTHT